MKFPVAACSVEVATPTTKAGSCGVLGEGEYPIGIMPYDPVIPARKRGKTGAQRFDTVRDGRWWRCAMEWLEWLLSREFRQFILSHDLFVPLLFLARVIFVTALELIAPARKISYRSVFLYDLVGCTLVGYILIPAAEFLSNRIALQASVPEVIMELPIAASFLLYYVVGDFGAYWMHRLMHTKAVWRAHKWHHSPTTMYWLAGYRASLPQQTLFTSLGSLPILCLVYHRGGCIWRCFPLTCC